MESLIRRAIGEVDESDLAMDGLVGLDDSTTFDADEGCHSGRCEMDLRQGSLLHVLIFVYGLFSATKPL